MSYHTLAARLARLRAPVLAARPDNNRYRAAIACNDQIRAACQFALLRGQIEEAEQE